MKNMDTSNLTIFGKVNRTLELAEHILREKGNVIDMETGDTMIHYLTQHGQVPLVREYVGKTVPINALNFMGRTPLHVAAAQEQLDIAEVLIERGANVNVTDIDGETPLFGAVRSINEDVGLELVDKLLKAGALAGVKNVKGQTPMHVAVKERNVYIVERLSQIGELLSLQDEKGNTPLHAAAEAGYDDIVYLLLEKGSIVNSQNRKGETPLHLAAQWGCYQALDYLIKRGARLNIQNEQGRTPLHTALASCECWVSERLVQEGALLNIKDNNGATPLYYAVEFNCVQDIQDMINRGASVDVLDNERKSPYDYATGDTRDFLELHFMKLKIAGLLVNADFDLKSTDYPAIRDSYQEEFEKLMSYKICETFQLGRLMLRKNTPYYLANEELLHLLDQVLQSPDFENEFPVYTLIFRDIYKNVRRRYVLLTSACNSFFSKDRKKWLQILPNMVKVKILEYLTDVELENLVKSVHLEFEYEF